MATTEVKTTPLHRLHTELGGRLTPFAGWELPVRFEGVIAEHQACRTSAALFDVSHMGIVELRSTAGTAESVGNDLETITPAAISTLGPGRQRYALLTNPDGGVIDDCIVTNRGDHHMIVVNASRRDIDLTHLRSTLAEVEITERTDLALLALQGPKAVEALARFAPDVADLVFLDFTVVNLNLSDGDGTSGGRIEGVGVSRSGYTGEDGFELMVATDEAERLARALLAQPEVEPAGLGARDTLRLEAGLHLYGNDLDETTSPIEADLAWTVPKRRRADKRFPGADRIVAEYENGPNRIRVGLKAAGKRPVRDGSALRTMEGDPAGIVTSGGFGPTIDGPVAMGYIPAELNEIGTVLVADVRGSDAEVEVHPLPFTPHNYHRGA
ncbi:MAG: glycine cleavage system aminomethyltransferase GcvT [Actinomycetia bacterium]|nr:glycine cleavage system aminomethyltransferase GcvT [Actinomycetes bacterium]